MRLLGVAALLLILGLSVSRQHVKRTRYITDNADINTLRILPRTKELFIKKNDGEWSPLCQMYWGKDEAEVACKQLGKEYHDWKWTFTSSHHTVDPPGIKCSGDEDNFSLCEPFPQGQGCTGQQFIVKCKDAEANQKKLEIEESSGEQQVNSSK